MASFIISTNVTTPQTLTGSQDGILTQNGSIAVLGDSANYAINAIGTNHDLAINGTVASISSTLFAHCETLDLVVGTQGNILSTIGNGLDALVTVSSDVVNNGTISSAGFSGIFLMAFDTSARHTLVNSGSISGAGNGVFMGARGPTSTITNSGVIEGGDIGIRASFSTDAVLEIWNTGTITGSDHSFLGSDDDGSGTSSDQVHNAGLMQGDIALLSGDDLYDGIGGFVLGTVDGGAGNDSLIGGAGNDTLRGGAGNDDVSGGDGEDRLLGGDGSDTLSGGLNDDRIFGGDDNDTIEGGAGNDYVSGGSGEDLLFGGEGADKLTGGADNDLIRSGDGADKLIGGDGADKLIGGAGADTFIYTAAGQAPAAGSFDIIRDFASGEDQIDLSDIVGPDLTFIGTGALSGAQGEVRYVTNVKGNASVFADVDGDGVADLRIFLLNVQSLDRGDFLL